uniref:Uncharacterized protein n=1 Tax=Anguilla anguilla TaxID=7936 RepID=A0A0E9TAX9_ANGAN
MLQSTPSICTKHNVTVSTLSVCTTHNDTASTPSIYNTTTWCYNVTVPTTQCFSLNTQQI